MKFFLWPSRFKNEFVLALFSDSIIFKKVSLNRNLTMTKLLKKALLADETIIEYRKGKTQLLDPETL